MELKDKEGDGAFWGLDRTIIPTRFSRNLTWKDRLEWRLESKIDGLKKIIPWIVYPIKTLSSKFKRGKI